MDGGTVTIEAKRFGLEEFIDVALEASQAQGEAANDQLVYLAAYLATSDLRAGTMVVESPYVDRHYMEEFSRYYATSLRPPANSATRIHFFKHSFDDGELQQRFEAAASGDAGYEDARQFLQDGYLGYCVVRPIPDAPVGRTVLQPYGDPRTFETPRLHRVHMGGLELTVSGVPFQQQEIAVGACATTAVWSALASVSRGTGQRSPTPYQITDAATQHYLNDRPFPADSGLELSQVLSAIRHFGFAPYVLRPRDQPGAFGMAVRCYLRSGIPVVLLVQDGLDYHAVTAVGYRDSYPDAEEPEPFLMEPNGLLRSPGFARLYVHEDRLGPYARMSWITRDAEAEGGRVAIQHEKFRGAAYGYAEDPMSVYAAIVPLYPKLRLSARGLMKVAAEMLPTIRGWVGPDLYNDVSVELEFALSGKYAEEVLRIGLTPDHRGADISGVRLPRYVGVVRFRVQGKAVADVICDTTDIHRRSPLYGSLLGIVVYAPSLVDAATDFADRAGPDIAVI